MTQEQLKQRRISLETAKQLSEWGCEIECRNKYGGKESSVTSETLSFQPIGTIIKSAEYPAYDLMHDICIDHAKEFFGEFAICEHCSLPIFDPDGYHNDCPVSDDAPHLSYEFYSTMILYLLQQNKKQEAEDYLLEHTLFNPKNR